jgi:hypothetical protein
MARISSYGVDATPSNLDKMLGTNPDGTVKNFTLGDIANHYSITNAIGVTGQMSYLYKTSQNWSAVDGDGTMHIATGSTDKAFSTITTIKLSKFQYREQGGGNNLDNFYSEFTNKEILIADVADLNEYGVFRCATVIQDSGNTDFYDLALTYVSGNGNITNLKNYTVVLFAGAQDKEFKFHQNNASATWTIAHNLNKFPSVTVQLTNGDIVVGDVSHTNKNNLTISFSSVQSGYAYLN